MRKSRKFPVWACLIAACLLLVCLAACDTADQGSEETTDAATTGAVTTAPNTEAATTEPAAEPEATEPATTVPETTEPEETDPPVLFDTPIADISKLSAYMQPILAGNNGTVKDETVYFIDKTEEYNTKTLLYPIKEVISVTSSPYYTADTELTVYEEGKDYEVVDGKLRITPDSAIPTLGYIENSNFVARYQVSVTYTTDAKWEGFAQTAHTDITASFIKKMQNGEDVTVIFYGDSITYGADCSYYINGVSGGRNGNEQYPYAILFTQALADLFDYRVEFKDIRGNEEVMPPVRPVEDYVGGTGDRGTITYINTAVGGMNFQGGIALWDDFVKKYVDEYGCDLLVVALGMNNGGGAIRSLVTELLNKAYETAPDAPIMMVATMHPVTGNRGQEGQISRLVEKLHEERGADCVTVRMSSISTAVLEYKTYEDYLGDNNVHPNDFFHRMYAQTLLQAVIGYENLK